MKARIFCEREVPEGRQFYGAIDYQYNEIRKLVVDKFCTFLSPVIIRSRAQSCDIPYVYLLICMHATLSM